MIEPLELLMLKEPSLPVWGYSEKSTTITIIIITIISMTTYFSNVTKTNKNECFAVIN